MQGLDLDEREGNLFSSSDGFYPVSQAMHLALASNGGADQPSQKLLHTILDFPYPTIALITGHVFGGACLLTLAHDYRVMNSKRGYWSMPPANLGLHHDGMGSLPSSSLHRKLRERYC